MAANDIILHQLDGTPDFNERTISEFAQGSLIVGDANGFPSKLAIGANAYVLTSNGTTASWAAAGAGHTQHTDTGTTNNTFTVDSDSTGGKIVIDANVAGTDNALTLTNATLDGDYTITFPAATGTVSLTSHDHSGTYEPVLTKGNLTETTSSVLTITGGTGSVIGSGTTIQVAAASGSTAGYLSSTDWNTFNNKMSTWVSAPASSSASGTAGQMAYDGDYNYICTATNTWRRFTTANWA